MPFATVIHYLSGVYALPWLVVGFILNSLFTRWCCPLKVQRFMKIFGNFLLYVLIPLLIFRLFLSVDFDTYAVIFSIISALSIGLMYFVSYIYARYSARRLEMSPKESKVYIKSIFTNQGRSSIFIGGALLSIEEWSFYAAIYLSIFGAFLFAVTPFILTGMAKTGENCQEDEEKEMDVIRSVPLDTLSRKVNGNHYNRSSPCSFDSLEYNDISHSISDNVETIVSTNNNNNETDSVSDDLSNMSTKDETCEVLNDKADLCQGDECDLQCIKVDEVEGESMDEVAVPVEVPSSQLALPLGLRIFPAVLMVTIISSIVLRRLTGTSFSAWGNIGSFLHFLSALTVPFGLYFAGAGIKTRDLSWSNLVLYLWPSKLTTQNRSEIQSILIIRGSLFTTLVLCPLIIGLIFFLLQVFGVASSAWFCVMFLNSLLPITSTNVFLVDYGLSLSGVSISVSMSTIIAVPLVFSLIPVFDSIYN
ncbi:hypothetical protein RCL1_006662 [Eukaryota sp. TZLM3-RCL]